MNPEIKVAIHEIESNYMNPSPAGTLNPLDFKKWGKNLAIFLGPVALIYFAAVAGSLASGFSWSAFVPSLIVDGAMALYAVNAATDLLRKFLADNTTSN